MTQDPPVTANTAGTGGDEGSVVDVIEVEVEMVGEQAEEDCFRTGGTTGGQAGTAG